MKKLLMKEFIENIDEFLDSDEVATMGCETCDFGSEYGVNYKITDPYTKEVYEFSTVEEYESNLFVKSSLQYDDDQTVEDFVSNIKITNKFTWSIGDKENSDMDLLPLFLPVKRGNSIINIEGVLLEVDKKFYDKSVEMLDEHKRKIREDMYK